MNKSIQKAIDDVERTKAKIAELQALLPELERKRTDLENTEVVRLMRSANVAPADIAGFIESLKAKPARQDSRANNGRTAQEDSSGEESPPGIRQEVPANDEE